MEGTRPGEGKASPKFTLTLSQGLEPGCILANTQVWGCFFAAVVVAVLFLPNSW